MAGPVNTETSTDYVTREAWLDQPGRADLVDEIADQFERRRASDTEAATLAWRTREPAPVEPLRHWPSSTGGWRQAG